MARQIMLSADFFDDYAVLQLRKWLKCSTGEIYIIRLWCLAMRAENHSGFIALDKDILKAFTGYRGAGEHLLEGLVSTRFLVPKKGHPGTYYLRGWSRNRWFFDKQRSRAAYMRAYYQKRKNEAQKRASFSTVDEQSTNGSQNADSRLSDRFVSDRFGSIEKRGRAGARFSPQAAALRAGAKIVIDSFEQDGEGVSS